MDKVNEVLIAHSSICENPEWNLFIFLNPPSKTDGATVKAGKQTKSLWTTPTTKQSNTEFS